jgi:cellobiose epimerase
MNTLLYMADQFPDDERGYYQKFCMQWKYCVTHLIDRERGGWYQAGTDVDVANIRSVKGSVWKCNFYTSRSLMSCIDRLRGRTLGQLLEKQR